MAQHCTQRAGSGLGEFLRWQGTEGESREDGGRGHVFGGGDSTRGEFVEPGLLGVRDAVVESVVDGAVVCAASAAVSASRFMSVWAAGCWPDATGLGADAAGVLELGPIRMVRPVRP
ncbi:MAG: hypothetical protein ACRDS1_17660 [Pseudonocardiaceae bacterium]